jgi:hypothetical protein
MSLVAEYRSHHEHDLEAYKFSCRSILVCHGRTFVGGDPRDRVAQGQPNGF